MKQLYVVVAIAGISLPAVAMENGVQGTFAQMPDKTEKTGYRGLLNKFMQRFQAVEVELKEIKVEKAVPVMAVGDFLSQLHYTAADVEFDKVNDYLKTMSTTDVARYNMLCNALMKSNNEPKKALLKIMQVEQAGIKNLVKKGNFYFRAFLYENVAVAVIVSGLSLWYVIANS